MSPVKKSAWQSQSVLKEHIKTNIENSNGSLPALSSAPSVNDSISTDTPLKLSVNDVTKTLHSKIMIPTGNKVANNNTATISANQKRKKRASKILFQLKVLMTL